MSWGMTVVSTDVECDDRCYFNCGRAATMYVSGQLTCTQCAGLAILQWLEREDVKRFQQSAFAKRLKERQRR